MRKNKTRCHIAIGDVDWCIHRLGETKTIEVTEAAGKKHLPLVCQHETIASADRMVQFLKTQGVKAKVVIGACEQPSNNDFGTF